MLRRDFLVGTSAFVGTTALAGSVPDSNPYPRFDEAVQAHLDSIRRRAATANEILLCWGLRGGKSSMAVNILSDMIRARGSMKVEVVGGSGAGVLNSNDLVAVACQEAARFVSGDVCVTSDYLYSSQFMMRQSWPPVDVVLIDEIDWCSADPSVLLNEARRRAQVVVAWSSPRVEHGGFLDLVRTRRGPGVLTSHAATWEVNPILTREVLLSERSRHPEQWSRDFAAYKYA